MKLKLSLLFVALATASSLCAAQQQGISKTEILVGTIQDLSGPLAGYGKQARNGMLLRIDEINEQGGINGRKIKLLVEDNGYDPKRAVLATQKLVNQDKVFLIASHIGTPMNNAAMPVMFEKNVINFMPLSAGREMYDPPHKLKFASVASYYDTMRMNVAKLYKEKGAHKACALYQDDEFGNDPALIGGGVRLFVDVEGPGLVPDGASMRDKPTLVCLHGGAFMWGRGAGALLEAVPVAATLGLRVIAAEYALAPEHTYPAAAEDVLAVHATLCRDMPASRIGIYGCSAGGVLTAQVVARLLHAKLPLPGAIAMLCGTGLEMAGDSAMTAGPLTGSPASINAAVAAATFTASVAGAASISR